MADQSDNDDVPQLSAATFAALQEFYKEQELREVKQNVINDNSVGDIDFDENWQLSQFWYDEATIDILVTAAIKSVGSKSKIALVSCPTLYKKLKEKLENVTLFEYDQRFAAFGKDFILYDYKSPLDIPRELSGCFDLVIADPPFLSDECLTKTAVTVKFLTKHKIILCTGAIMAELSQRLLDVKKCESFEPRHKNNLANEFWCYTNFDLDSYLKNSI